MGLDTGFFCRSYSIGTPRLQVDCYRIKVLSLSEISGRLIATKELGTVVDKVVWLDNISPEPETTKEITLGEKATDASTGARVGVSCQYKNAIRNCKSKSPRL